MEQQLVIFDLAGEQYGVDIAAVEGIIKMQAITAVPRAPDFVTGVTNLRGKVLPVLDLRQRFRLPEAQAGRDTRIVVVEVGSATLGIIVDAVSEVLRVSGEAIEPPSPIVTTVDLAFLRGIARVGERLVILLDLAHILNQNEMSHLQALPAVA